MGVSSNTTRVQLFAPGAPAALQYASKQGFPSVREERPGGFAHFVWPGSGEVHIDNDSRHVYFDEMLREKLQRHGIACQVSLTSDNDIVVAVPLSEALHALELLRARAAEGWQQELKPTKDAVLRITDADCTNISIADLLIPEEDAEIMQRGLTQHLAKLENHFRAEVQQIQTNRLNKQALAFERQALNSEPPPEPEEDPLDIPNRYHRRTGNPPPFSMS